MFMAVGWDPGIIHEEILQNRIKLFIVESNILCVHHEFMDPWMELKYTQIHSCMSWINNVRNKQHVLFRTRDESAAYLRTHMRMHVKKGVRDVYSCVCGM